MEKNNRCCAGSSDKYKRGSDRIVKRTHVEKLPWHCFTQDLEKGKEWMSLISEGRAEVNLGSWTYACSIHFVGGTPTTQIICQCYNLLPQNRRSYHQKRRKTSYQQIDSKESKVELEMSAKMKKNGLLYYNNSHLHNGQVSMMSGFPLDHRAQKSSRT